RHDGARYHGAARHDRPPRHPPRIPPRGRRGAPRGTVAARHALLVSRRLVRVLERADPRRSARAHPRGVRRAGRLLRAGGNRAVRRARPRRGGGVLGRRPLPAARARLGLPRSRADLVGAARAGRRPGPAGHAARVSHHRAAAVDRHGLAGADRHGAGEYGELSLVADYNNNAGIGSSSSTPFNSVDLWLKAEYLPTPRVGVSYQVASSAWKRSPSDVAGLTDHFEYKRRDGIFRLFAAAREDGLGPRLDLTFVTTTAAADSAVIGRSLSQGALAVGSSWGHGHVRVTFRSQDEDRPWQIEGSAAWIPLRPFTLAAGARHARYGNSRSGERLHLAAGLALPLGLTLHGDVAWANDLGAPALASDSAQRTTDVSGAVRWDRHRVTLEVGLARRDAFVPLGHPAGLRPLGGLGPTQATRYLTVHGALEPLPGLHLAGWYFDPYVSGGNDFEPPYHARVSATFYSKFWRVYKSGVFALRGEIAMESWSRGTAGVD